MGLHSAVALKEGPLEGRRCVASETPDSWGAVYAQPDSAGAKGWLPYSMLEASPCSYCFRVKDVRYRVK
jgi:hypothetical protein